MSYDIGIGLCTAIDGQEVSVGLDSAMLSKLSPGASWRKSGTSSLRFDIRLCSTKRPLKVGDEVYLDSAAIEKKATAMLDMAGVAELVRVNLHELVRGMDPMPAPQPATKRAYGSFPAGRARK
ncbi:hypothetical protein FCE95_02630 [Luteimonas gilva]|uniref:Uncharacterized protein n=1 Tax=Luteimonas gilva TaxID=2572684 RepID=A0A4U5JTR7_9GAMM|nr:hypothetical protein [Luteimonas gilva]TKR33224.1 hypothetical protein FCE95_02630 [Luteimonas gilva]